MAHDKELMLKFANDIVPDLVLAGILHRIHQGIGQSYHFIHARGCSGKCHHSNAECHWPFIFLHGTQKTLLNFPDSNFSFLCAGLRKKNCEFITAEARHLVADAQARHQIHGAEILFEPAGNGNEQLVPNTWPQAVVDQLESVQIEEDDREGTEGDGIWIARDSRCPCDEEGGVDRSDPSIKRDFRAGAEKEKVVATKKEKGGSLHSRTEAEGQGVAG
jgi:hypothetical protein